VPRHLQVKKQNARIHDCCRVSRIPREVCRHKCHPRSGSLRTSAQFPVVLVGLYMIVVKNLRLYLVVALVAKTLFLMLLVARWLRTVWFGITNTLLSSFIGVVWFKMLFPRNPGNEGGVGRLLIAALARDCFVESSGRSRSARYRGIV